MVVVVTGDNGRVPVLFIISEFSWMLLSEGEFEDEDNLILVGVWLAEKENGLTLFNLLSWIELPNQENDDHKFL